MAVALLCAAGAWAQTDVTSTYLANPSFETDATTINLTNDNKSTAITGWVIDGIDSNAANGYDGGIRSTSNDTYKITNSDGDYLLHIWGWWQGNPTVKQTVNLPAGTYKLSAVISTDTDKHVEVFAGSNISNAAGSGEHVGVEMEVIFTLNEQQNIEIGARNTDWGWNLLNVDNFKLYKYITIDTDLTSQFSALTNWENWSGATGYTATNFCPKVTPNGLPEVQVCEKYETSCTTTGDIFYQTISGLSVGTYRIELYGGAAFTYGRGFGSQAFTGETGTGDAWETHYSDTYTAGQHIDTETGVTLYAQTSTGTVSKEIPIYYATNFPDGAATVSLDNVIVGSNGEVKIGMSKTSQSTNWHVVQLKGVTATVDAPSLLATTVSDASALEEKLPVEIWNDLNDVIEEYNQSYLTASEYETAITAINAAKENALSAALEANKSTIITNKGDITSLINGTFDENADGWTFVNDHESTKTEIDRYNGSSWRGENNYYVDCNNRWYTVSTTLNNMPAGTYKLVAAMRGKGFGIRPSLAGTDGAYFYGTNETMINTNGVQFPVSDITKNGMHYENEGTQWNWVSLTANLAEDGDLVIKFKMEANNNCWACLDDVHLYCTSLDGTSYTVSANNITGNTLVNTNNGTNANREVVTCDIITSNPNAIVRTSRAIMTAAGEQMNNNKVGATDINKLVLYDGYPYSDYTDNTFLRITNGATLYRNIPADTWCTLVVPFNPTNLDQMLVPSGLSAEGVLSFTSAGTTSLNNKPMLVKSTEGVTAITGVRANSTQGVSYGDMTSGEGVNMIGTYSAIDAVPEGSYVVARKNDADALYKVNSTVSLAPFRAYFSVADGGSVKANVIALNFDDLPTSIEEIPGVEFTIKDAAIYNLAGQRMSKMLKGVNIINGKKVLVK